MKHTSSVTSVRSSGTTGTSCTNTDHPDSTVRLSDILGPPVSRQEALARIRSDSSSCQTFFGFPPKEQERILGFIQGNHGLPILYDSFFKKIMNPEACPERLEQFLSALMGEPVHIRSVIPLEGTKLIEAGSLVIMDIVVELTNGTVVDVEMPKIGYAFPGERSSCYLADFIMRQYNRVKSERKQYFSFHDLKPVWLIILMETSPDEFCAVAPHYIHREIRHFDSGANVRTLGNLIYISLDTFHSVVQNVSTELDAWLTFLSSDQPEDIVRLVSSYPRFRDYYQDILDFRRHPKELIGMISEALTIMDRNMALYMCENWKKEADELKKEAEDLKRLAEVQKKEAEDLKRLTETQKKEAEDLKRLTETQKKEAADLKRLTETQKKEAADLKKQIELQKKDLDSVISEKDSVISEKDSIISEKDSIIASLQKQLRQLQQQTGE